MICNCGGMTRAGTWETIDGYKHFSETCTACGRYHRLPSIKIEKESSQMELGGTVAKTPDSGVYLRFFD